MLSSESSRFEEQRSQASVQQLFDDPFCSQVRPRPRETLLSHEFHDPHIVFVRVVPIMGRVPERDVKGSMLPIVELGDLSN